MYSDYRKAIEAADRVVAQIEKPPVSSSSSGEQSNSTTNSDDSFNVLSKVVVTHSAVVAHGIVLRNVSFSYKARSAAPVIQNLSLHIPSNSLTAIVILYTIYKIHYNYIHICIVFF